MNKSDEDIGVGDKMHVHKHGILHRAFSVFVLNKNNQLLLQQRAFSKYHSPGLWTNTCCSHAFPNYTLEEGIHLRLNFEMGFDCQVQKLFIFHYQVSFDNGLTENEIDHVYIGRFEGEPIPNPDEVASWRWIDLEKLTQDIETNPQDYTFWFRVALNKFVFTYQELQKNQ